MTVSPANATILVGDALRESRKVELSMIIGFRFVV